MGIKITNSPTQLSQLLTWNTGRAFTAGNYQIGRNADGTNQMQFNVPTGAGFEFSINDVAEVLIDSNGDLQVLDGGGFIVGHNAQITGNSIAEAQISGTADIDTTLQISRFSADTSAPGVDFVKSRHATLGSNTIVNDNDVVSILRSLPADGTDFATLAASYQTEVDDSSPAAGDIGMAHVWSTMAGGGAALTEKLRLTAAGGLTFNQASTISTGTGHLEITPASGSHIGLGAAATSNFVNLDFAAETVTASMTRLAILNSNAITTNTSGLISSLFVSEPNISIGSRSPTNSATLYISSVATEATNNYALWSASGVNRFGGEVELDGDLNHDGTNVGFYGTAPIAQQTGVAVTAAGIHAALVALGLITA